MWVPLLLAMALPSTAVCQKPKVEVFGIGDGLPSSDVLDLAQGPSGRVWIVTTAGTVLYDGRDFSGGVELPEGELGAVEVDASGRVWAAARQKGPAVYLRQEGAWTPLPTPTDLEGDSVVKELAVVAGEERDLVAAGSPETGLWRWDGRSWSHDLAAGVTALAAFDESIAVGTSSGLCRADEKGVDCSGLRADDPRLSEPIVALFSSATSDPPRLWILSYDWLGYLEQGGLEVVADDIDLPRQPLSRRGAILADPVGGVYFGVPQQGFFRSPSGRRIAMGVRAGFPGDGATRYLLDHEGNAWVGSTRGLAMIDSWRFLSMDEDSGLLEDEVSAILESAPGRLVLGHNTGLTLLDGSTFHTHRFDLPAGAARDTSRVMDLALDADGTVWATANDLGLFRIDPDLSLTAHSPTTPVTSVELDSRGRLWVAGRHELFVRSGNGFSRVDLGSNDTLRWLTAGPDGAIYLSTADGLLWHDGRDGGGGWQRARGPDADANTLYGVLAEPNGEVWVCTRAGLFRLAANGSLERVRRDGLRIDRAVYSILRDGEGRYWFGTDDGVFVWDGSELRQLTVRHGLIGRETNRGAALVDHRGTVWIGTERGVSAYQPAYDPSSRVAPRAEVRALDVAGQRQPLGRDLRLAAGRDTFTFHIGSVALSREEEVQYTYRLEGLERDWLGPQEVPPAGVRYAGVPPGRYRFRVVASWPGGQPGPQALSPTIVLLPPMWRRTWFLVLCALLVAGGLIAGHWARTRSIRARNVELAAIAKERQDLIDELERKNAELERFAYTISHDLKTPLVTIGGFLGLVRQSVERGDIHGVKSDLERIRIATATMERLLKDLLEHSRIGHLPVPNDEIPLDEVVTEVLGQAADRLDDAGIEVRRLSALPVVIGHRGRIHEVVQNLIDNAIQFMGDESRPRIEIGVRHEPDDYGAPILFIRDNGIGINPRHHQKIFGLFDRLHAETPGSGVGLAIVKRIVESHGGRVWVESRGRGSGTTFCWTLPVPRDRPSPGPGRVG